MDLEKIKNTKTKFLGKEIIYKKEIDSTQNLAKALAKEAKNGCLIITDNQTNGRGTKGKSWISSKEKNITMTLIINENIEISKLDGITLKIAEIIKDVIKELYSYKLTIKQPNDLLLNNKKICGILTETSIINSKVNYILIGIGFNVNEDNFNEKLRKYCNFIKRGIWQRI